ncbi:hypothetical protein RM531_05335 [Salinisphaera sp. P385]|uniref:Uncharacterized protein n=1 Tax=Spectribacter acetivorans TaxID=3075603 RepID=A0ABU3B609_9GAMM|nr:hypothetical protein [Salinisphaera sp. P385]MDT0617886.1 hypothetical protein [Salinisphaera sp. P385]
MRRALTIILLAAVFIGAVALVYQERHPLRTLWVDQSKLCLFTSDDEASQCKPGELAYFKPPAAVNNQVMLNVAAAYCDAHHQVVWNSGGVICVFTRERMHRLGR